MVTSDENGILRDLAREGRMVQRQALLKRLWRLQKLKEERAKPAAPESGCAVDRVVGPHHGRVARHNLDLGTAD